MEDTVNRSIIELTSERDSPAADQPRISHSSHWIQRRKMAKSSSAVVSLIGATPALLMIREKCYAGSQLISAFGTHRETNLA